MGSTTVDDVTLVWEGVLDKEKDASVFHGTRARVIIKSSPSFCGSEPKLHVESFTQDAMGNERWSDVDFVHLRDTIVCRAILTCL